MALPLLLCLCEDFADSHAGAMDTGVKTFQEWLAIREGLWLNDKNAVIGLSRLNPLPKNSAVNKSLAKGAKAKAATPLATFKPWKPAQPVKIVGPKPSRLSGIEDTKLPFDALGPLVADAPPFLLA
jgi:hypothetical protein